jgi:hypothetical protein
MTVRRSTRPPTPPEIVELVERPATVVRLDATMEGFPRLIGEAFGLTATAIAESGRPSPAIRSRGTWRSATGSKPRQVPVRRAAPLDRPQPVLDSSGRTSRVRP